MNIKVRAMFKDAAVRAFESHIENQVKIFNQPVFASCVNCIHFDEGKEICIKYNARPPARVIALSCDSWCDNDDIPF